MHVAIPTHGLPVRTPAGRGAGYYAPLGRIGHRLPDLLMRHHDAQDGLPPFLCPSLHSVGRWGLAGHICFEPLII